MAPSLNAVSLLLIGGVTGALAFGGDRGERIAETVGLPDWSAITRAATAGGVGSASIVAAAVPSASLTVDPTEVAVPVANRSRPSSAGDAGRGAVTSLRIAQATTGSMTDAPVRHYPSVRPVPGNPGTVQGADAPSAQARLAGSIQKELQRVGCYSGALDGDWGPETRRAMKAFNDRVNASLPTDQPDYILLTLLQGHTAKACGAACPAGQSLSDAGKCLPHSVIAEERRRLAAAVAIAASTRPHHVVAAPEARTGIQVVPPPTPRRPTPTAMAVAGQDRPRSSATETARRQHEADARARSEIQRLQKARQAETARLQAEARRKAELVALAAPVVKNQTTMQATSTLTTGSIVPTASSGTAATTIIPPLPTRPSAAFQARQVAARVTPQIVALVESKPQESAEPAKPKIVHPHHQTRSREARYIGRYMPPPTYRLGRVQPSRYPAVRVYGYAPPAEPVRRRNPQRFFHELQNRMP